mgnify:CR=1 FL=1
MAKFIFGLAALDGIGVLSQEVLDEATDEQIAMLFPYSQAVSLKRIADALEKLTTTKGLLQLAGDMIEEADAIKALAEKLR